MVNSARLLLNGGCSGGKEREKMDGRDSLTIRAQDIETLPAPGKPFDVAIYQQVPAIEGGVYSLSGWLVSYCGGTFSAPNDCPKGYYMSKQLGIDPTGGTDPLAKSVIWAENRENFIDATGNKVGWVNVRLAAVALAPTITVFARLLSPFQWHGDHGYIDILSLIRAPLVEFIGVPAKVQSQQVTLTWDKLQSPDVTQIPGGVYELLFDVQARHMGDTTWQDTLVGAKNQSSTVFTARCSDTSYEFRIRARAEQPDVKNKAQPNQRYPGVWSAPLTVRFESIPGQQSGLPGKYHLYLPVIMGVGHC